MNENHLIRFVVLLVLAGCVVIVALAGAGKLVPDDSKPSNPLTNILDPSFATTAPPTTTATTTTAAPTYDDSLSRVLFSDALIEQYGGRCLDGTAAGYYIQKTAETSPNNKKWIIYLEGGGYCRSQTYQTVLPWPSLDNCTDRVKTPRGSSSFWTATRTQSYSTNILTRNPTMNPNFYNWNFVFVPYCSGDLWGGNRTVNSTISYGLYFAGRLIVRSAFESLRSELSSATDIILTGDSAGGIGTLINLDTLAGWVNDATQGKAFVAGLAQAGWFNIAIPYATFLKQLPNPSNANYRPPTFDEGAGVGHEAAVQFAYQEECASKTKPEFLFYCLTPPYFYRFIRTPLFIAQNLLDTYQIRLLNYANLDGGIYFASYLQFFADAAKKSLTEQIINRNFVNSYNNPDNYIDGYNAEKLLVDNPQLKYNGLYAALCLKHQTQFTNWNPFERVDPQRTTAGYPNVAGRQIHAVFSDWYNEIKMIRSTIDISKQDANFTKPMRYIDQTTINPNRLCIGVD